MRQCGGIMTYNIIIQTAAAALCTSVLDIVMTQCDYVFLSVRPTSLSILYIIYFVYT